MCIAPLSWSVEDVLSLSPLPSSFLTYFPAGPHQVKGVSQSEGVFAALAAIMLLACLNLPSTVGRRVAGYLSYSKQRPR
jgi:hypothetical protein